jgi:hypothetical protein
MVWCTIFSLFALWITEPFSTNTAEAGCENVSGSLVPIPRIAWNSYRRAGTNVGEQEAESW